MPGVRENGLDYSKTDETNAQDSIHPALILVYGRQSRIADAFQSHGARCAGNRAVKKHRPKDDEDDGRIAL